MDTLSAFPDRPRASDLAISIGDDAGALDAGTGSMDWAFGLATPEFKLFTNGLAQRVPAGPAETLGARVDAFFDQLQLTERPAPRIVVGALPFDRTADDCLFLPQTASNTPWPMTPKVAAPRSDWQVIPEPSRAHYEAAVARTLDAIRDAGPELEKVVLSRSLKVVGSQVIDPFSLWSTLRADMSVTRFLTPLGTGPNGAMRRLVGASPELLVAKQGAAVSSNPLAGSARRSLDPSEDEAGASALLKSEKDRREHAFVVEAILDALAPYCRELKAPSGPALHSTRTVWHLGTRIDGLLRHPEETSSAELAAALHPTPAVAGAPRDRAVELIKAVEGYDRGFYSGAVGWTNAGGDGAWYVSLRCAETCGAEARLYAGAGVVTGSTPEAEADETSNKFQAVLQALGVQEDTTRTRSRQAAHA